MGRNLFPGRRRGADLYIALAGGKIVETPGLDAEKQGRLVVAVDVHFGLERRVMNTVLVADAVRAWINAVGAKTAYIEPGSPWENGYCESFNARFRDELLDGEIFHTLKEAQIIIEIWRKHYNTKRPHSALGYRPPAPETIIQMATRPAMH